MRRRGPGGNGWKRAARACGAAGARDVARARASQRRRARLTGGGRACGGAFSRPRGGRAQRTLPRTEDASSAGTIAGNTWPRMAWRRWPASVAGWLGGTRLSSSRRTSSAMSVPYTKTRPPCMAAAAAAARRRLESLGKARRRCTRELLLRRPGAERSARCHGQCGGA